MIRIAFIGSGNMAEAIIGGVLDAGLFKKEEILASDINVERLSALQSKWGVQTTQNDAAQLAKAPVLVFSVKPQNLEAMIACLGASFQKETLLISILAGVSFKKMEALLHHHCSLSSFPMVRVMPNLGAFARKSVTAICFNDFVSEAHKELVTKIFESVGWTHLCDESFMNAVTAVSGSGPAYVFYFMEAFIEGAKHLGFSDTQAIDFCYETLCGAYALLLQRENTPQELRAKVTSPGGTTEAAIRSLESNHFKSLFIKALQAAKNRAMELTP
jgi:pyrroline-5-carboxylate reductase